MEKPLTMTRPAVDDLAGQEAMMSGLPEPRPKT